MLLKLHQISGGFADDIEVTDAIYGVSEINKIAIAQVVRWQLHKRAGSTSYTKTRSEVAGSGRKIYRQKGTGNARHSDKYAPQFRKGGVAHGPKSVQWTMTVPKKIKKLALRHVFSAKQVEGKLVVMNTLVFDAPKTKQALSSFSDYQGKKVLFIDIQEKNSAFAKSISNIVGFDYLPVAGLNVYDILRADVIVIAKDALETIEKRLLT